MTWDRPTLQRMTYPCRIIEEHGTEYFPRRHLQIKAPVNLYILIDSNKEQYLCNCRSNPVLVHRDICILPDCFQTFPWLPSKRCRSTHHLQKVGCITERIISIQHICEPGPAFPLPSGLTGLVTIPPSGVVVVDKLDPP